MKRSQKNTCTFFWVQQLVPAAEPLKLRICTFLPFNRCILVPMYYSLSTDIYLYGVKKIKVHMLYLKRCAF